MGDPRSFDVFFLALFDPIQIAIVMAIVTIIVNTYFRQRTRLTGWNYLMSSSTWIGIIYIFLRFQPELCEVVYDDFALAFKDFWRLHRWCYTDLQKTAMFVCTSFWGMAVMRVTDILYRSVVGVRIYPEEKVRNRFFMENYDPRGCSITDFDVSLWDVTLYHGFSRCYKKSSWGRTSDGRVWFSPSAERFTQELVVLHHYWLVTFILWYCAFVYL